MKNEMTKEEMVDLLKSDVKKWNEWRKNDRDVLPDLQGADLSHTDLQKADFSNADLTEAKLIHADLTGADLSLANLHKTDLREADLTEADLQETDLTEANLRDADLTGARLISANLQGACLINANLRGAYLISANFRGAELKGADIKGANLTHSDLSEAVVSGIIADRSSKYRGIIVDTCKGSPRFKRLAQDEDYLEEYRDNHEYLYWIWQIFADCGRSFWRWIMWSLFFAAGYAEIFYYLGEESFKMPTLYYNFWSMLYYSIVTFTTLGFGNVVPETGLAAFWVAMEVITGYVMLGGLISIFSTKLARRS